MREERKGRGGRVQRQEGDAKEGRRDACVNKHEGTRSE